MIIASYYYDAFGVILEETGSNANPYRYSGYYYDSGADLYNLNARFYDAEIARFLQEDTYRGQASDPLSLNLYTYCFNNPLVYYDPSGHAPLSAAQISAAIVGIIIATLKSNQILIDYINSRGNSTPTNPTTEVTHPPLKDSDGITDNGNGGSAESPGINDFPIPDGECLKQVQKKLNELGYKGENRYRLVEDGKMGPQTRFAVEKFQRDNGLNPTGDVDKKTWDALFGSANPSPGETSSKDYSAGTKYIVITKSDPLIMRSGAGTGYNQIGSIPKGATVTCTGSKPLDSGGRQWVEVTYNGNKGWVAFDLLDEPPGNGGGGNGENGNETSGTSFTPVPVESVGGGRIQDSSEAKPENLVAVTDANGQTQYLDYRAAEALLAMQKAAYADGIATNLLTLTSGYRSDASQQPLWDAKFNEIKAANPSWSQSQVEYETRKWVAKPGSSPHRTGRALDLYLGINGGSADVLAGKYNNLPAFLWLQQNAATYGFYPYTTEPWHWEYNPPNK